MKRLLLTLAVVTAALSFESRLAQAAEAPWCAVVSVGTGSVYWDCQYRTVEECVPHVLAGNRGFCNHNPRWEGSYQPAEPLRRHKKRHVRRD